MSYALPIAAAITGALAGPWLRARILAHAVPYGRPPRTRCPACRHQIPQPLWRARLPVTGRCPACARRIGPAPGAVEACAATSLALLAWRSPDPAVFAAGAWLALYGVLLSFVDISVRRLPDRLMWQAFAGCATILAATGILTGQPGRIVAAAGGALLFAMVYLVQVVARPDAIGMGDAKIAGTVGLTLGWLGYTAVFTGFAAGVLLGAAAALVLLAGRRITIRQPIAYGPAILAGALVAYGIHAPIG